MWVASSEHTLFQSDCEPVLVFLVVDDILLHLYLCLTFSVSQVYLRIHIELFNNHNVSCTKYVWTGETWIGCSGIINLKWFRHVRWEYNNKNAPREGRTRGKGKRRRRWWNRLWKPEEKIVNSSRKWRIFTRAILWMAKGWKRYQNGVETDDD